MLLFAKCNEKYIKTSLMFHNTKFQLRTAIKLLELEIEGLIFLLYYANDILPFESHIIHVFVRVVPPEQHQSFQNEARSRERGAQRKEQAVVKADAVVRSRLAYL